MYNFTGSSRFITVLHAETPKLYYVIYEQPLRLSLCPWRWGELENASKTHSQFYTEKGIFSSYFLFCLLLSSIGFVREAHCCDARCREQQDFFPPPISLTHSHYITLNPSFLDSNWVQSRTLSIPHVAPINLHQALKMNKKVWDQVTLQHVKIVQRSRF